VHAARYITHADNEKGKVALFSFMLFDLLATRAGHFCVVGLGARVCVTWMRAAAKDKQTLGHKTADFIFTCAMNCSVWPQSECAWERFFNTPQPGQPAFEVFITRAAINLLI
jgi:hypothetical protein